MTSKVVDNVTNAGGLEALMGFNILDASDQDLVRRTLEEGPEVGGSAVVWKQLPALASNSWKARLHWARWPAARGFGKWQVHAGAGAPVPTPAWPEFKVQLAAPCCCTCTTTHAPAPAPRRMSLPLHHNACPCPCTTSPPAPKSPPHPLPTSIPMQVAQGAAGPVEASEEEEDEEYEPKPKAKPKVGDTVHSRRPTGSAAAWQMHGP